MAPIRKSKSKSKSAHAGLVAGVSRMERRIRDARIAKQVGGHSSIFMTGLVEQVMVTILDRAANEAQAGKKKRINLVHILKAVRSDPDTARLLSGFAFGSALNLPKVSRELMSSDEKKKRKQQQEEKSA